MFSQLALERLPSFQTLGVAWGGYERVKLSSHFTKIGKNTKIVIEKCNKNVWVYLIALPPPSLTIFKFNHPINFGLATPLEKIGENDTLKNGTSPSVKFS